MRGVRRPMLGLIGLALLGAPPVAAGRLDCTSRWLSKAERLICDEPVLWRTEEQLARRLDGFAQRLNFGQYLGLRHWHGKWARQRSLCENDRECIQASYRAQARFLDRFQRCVAGSLARRACLRDAIAGDRESVRQ